MDSNYKKLRDGYGGSFSREGYAAPAVVVAPKLKPLCKASTKKNCNICDMSKVGVNVGNNYGHRGASQSIDNYPKKDAYTYQVCGLYEVGGGSCGGKHYCTDKYIYETTDVDGLTIKKYTNIPSLNECYNKIDYVNAKDNTLKEKGVVYDTKNKTCWTIKEIPNMDQAKLTVSWAYNKQNQKPYHNDNTILVIKK